MIHTSASSSSLLRLMISARCGEPASSSPSKKNLMFEVSGMPFVFECAERSQNRHHAGFIVRRRTRVDAPLGIDSRARSWTRHDLSAGFDRSGAKDRLPRQRSGPLFWICRLAVVVRVNEYRALRAGHFPFAVNGGRRVWRCAFEQARIQSALLHHLDDERGVLADVFSVAGDVRDAKGVW